MIRHHGVGTALSLALLGSLGGLAGLVACSGAASSTPDGDGEHVAQSQQDLLSTPCTITSGNLSLTLKNGEVGYIGYQAGCTASASDTCVVTNAVDSMGKICKVNSKTAQITVTGTNVAGNSEELVLDYTNGFFGLNGAAPDGGAQAPLVNVTLDTKAAVASDAGAGQPPVLSKVTVVAPSTGGNMALGVNGLDVNTLASRTKAYADVKLAWSTAAAPGTLVFQGGPGADCFTADATGWVPSNAWGTAPSAAWLSASVVATAVGAAYTGPVTAAGNAGDDVLAGGAGANTLDGNAGFDTFLQSANSHAETFSGGDDIDTVSYAIRTASVTASIASGAISTYTWSAAGTNYKVGDVLTVAGGSGTATLTVTAVNSGAITTATLSSPGTGFVVSASPIATTGGSGTGATIAVSAINAADDGAAGEGDNIGGDVEMVIGGSGADYITAGAVAATDVILIGGAGNDTLVGGGGNDDLCGGPGNDRLMPWIAGAGGGNDILAGDLPGGTGAVDTVDFSGAGGVVHFCLSPSDPNCFLAADAGSPSENGVGSDIAVVNNASFGKVCPRATSFTVGQVGGGTTTVSVPSAGQGPTMQDDVQNVTGASSYANLLDCDKLGGSRTAACSLVGGSGADTLQGTTNADLIYGKGGADSVTTNGGSDFIDLTPSTGTVTCAASSDSITILYSGGTAPTLNTCVAGTITEIGQ